jgi:hypothetical protein
MQNESLTFTLGQDDCPPELLRSRPPPTFRKSERERMGHPAMGVSRHTLETILKGKPVRRKTLAKITKKLSIVMHETGNPSAKGVR